MFEVGTLVICNRPGMYSCTDTDALCIVMAKHYSYMNVKIIATNRISELNSTHSVDPDVFEEITAGKYLFKFPSAYKCANFDEIVGDYTEEYNKYKEIYPNITYPEPSEPLVLSDEMRKELLNEMMELYMTYDYAPTEKGVNAQLDEWAKNKGNLIKWMENHPNYNGKFQIAFDVDFQRRIDIEAIITFFDYLKSLIPESKIGPFTFSEVYEIKERLESIIYIFEGYDGIRNINEHDKEYYKSECEKFRNYVVEFRRRFRLLNRSAYSMENYELKNKIDCLINGWLSMDSISHIADEKIAQKFNCYFPELKATNGQKISRIVNKLCKQLGFDKDKGYNREFAKFSDAINPLTIKRHTVLSCHPVDYLTMSFGNSWSSCHTIDKNNKRDMPNSYHGQYSAGTLSYMLDETSAVFYTVDAKYDGDKLELEPKINRCMFHIGEYKVVQGRVYPQDNDGENGIYTEIRNIVQKIIADCWEKPNVWVLKKGTSACARITNTKGVHYRDYLSYDSCNVSYLKLDESGIVNDESITIGHNPICPQCGDEHTYEESVECIDCYDEYRNEDNDDDDDDDETDSDWTDTWMEAV